MRESDLDAWKRAAYEADLSLSEWVRRHLNDVLSK